MRRSVDVRRTTRHRPARDRTVELQGEVRLLRAQVTAVQSDDALEAVRDAADLPAARTAIAEVISEATV